MKINETGLSFGSNCAWGNKPQAIVYHHAEASNCSVYDVHSWHKNNGWAGIGYHYFVRKDGSIWKGRPDNMVGSHVGGYNTNTLGICAEGSYMTETMPTAQKQALIELGIYLCEKYGITRVYGHREVGSSNCPGTKFPLEEIRQAVKNKEIQGGKPKVKYIVIYNGVDKRGAELLADYLQCPTISNERPFDFNCVEHVFAVGGKKENYTSHLETLIAGSDRYETMQKVLEYIRK